MKTYSIAEINDLDHGIPISRFEGRIKKVFDQKSGEGQYGIWYLQNLIVEDGQQEITVTWTGDDPFETASEGHTYSFETGYDKKEKPVGIVRDIRNKNGKKYEGVKVDNRSKIARMDNGSSFSNARATMQQGEPRMPRSDDEQDWPEQSDPVGEMFKQSVANAPQSPPTRRETGIPGFAKREYTNAPQSPHAQQGEDGVMATRKHLMQSANLLVLCINAADKAVAPHVPNIAQTTEFFLATVGKLYIEASGRRSDDNVTWWSYIDKMPTTPLVPNGKHSTIAKPIQKEEETDEPPF